MRIRIAVASCQAFSEKTLPIVIPSLLKAGVPSEDIVIFEGGHANETRLGSTVEHWLVPHDSFEYTPLIEIVRRDMQSDYWFLMHDTCKVGPAFLDSLYDIPPDMPTKVAMRSFPSMSMGSYRHDYLMSRKAQLFEARNDAKDREGRMKAKAWGLHREDHLLWRDTPQDTRVYARPEGTPEVIVVSEESWYGTSTSRRVEYFPSLDLFKCKSNWGQTPVERMVIDV